MNELIVTRADGIAEIDTSAAEYIVSLEKQIKDLQKQEKDLKERLCEAMGEHGIYKYENDDIIINRIDENPFAIAFNQTKFKEEHPDLYDEYSDVRPKKAYVSMR